MNLKDLFRKEDKKEEVVSVESLSQIWEEYCRSGYRYILTLRCFRKTYAIIEKMLLLCPGGIILDGGCGTGGMFKLILKRIKPSKIIAVDFSEEMLKEAKENASKLAGESKDLFEFKNLDLTKAFSWPDNMFDAEVFNLTLCYLPNQTWIGTTKEAYRVLKPGGHAYISIMLKGWDFPRMIKERMLEEFIANPINCLLAKRIQKSSEKINKCIEKGIIQYPSEEEYLELLERIGFINIEKEHIFWGAGLMLRAQKSLKTAN